MSLHNLPILRSLQAPQFSPHRVTEICTLLMPTGCIRKWHAITGTKFPLLCLDIDIIQVHIVLDCTDIFMPQQFLQAEDVPAEHEVAHCKGVPEDVGADTLA